MVENGIEDYSKPFTSDYLLKKEITYSKEWFDFESFNLFLVNNSWHVKKKSWIMEGMLSAAKSWLQCLLGVIQR